FDNAIVYSTSLSGTFPIVEFFKLHSNFDLDQEGHITVWSDETPYYYEPAYGVRTFRADAAPGWAISFGGTVRFQVAEDNTLVRFVGCSSSDPVLEDSDASCNHWVKVE
ncbi:MAG: hypothetical protein AAF974_09070, partial [Cyanobacteria bacterium P01_E01_bin.34]